MCIPTAPGYCILLSTITACIITAAFYRWDVSSSPQVPSSNACTKLEPPPCNNNASPGALQITPDPGKPDNGLKLAHKTFYLSSCPFDFANSVNLRTAPSVRDYYQRLGVSSQLIQWLEENHCQSVYCRELTVEEVNCGVDRPTKCVPEFISAFRNAVSKLNGNQDLARRWVTNFAPLSDAKLRVGFYEAQRDWLNSAVQGIEKRMGSDTRIRSTVSDNYGVAVFYDLCPGTYYLSTIAPINVDGVDMIWETARPIKIEGPPDVKTITRVTLAFPPGKDKKNYFVGRPLAEIVAQKPPTQ